MKHRLGKFGIVFLALALALTLTGAAFAAWTDDLTIDGTVTTGELDWELMGPVTQADLGNDQNCFFDLNGGVWVPMGKDVGNTQVVISDPDTMTVTVNNAYPYYGNHIAFKLHGLGTIPLKFWKINYYVDGILVDTSYVEDEYVYLDLDGDEQYDLEVWYGDHLGWQFHNCTKADVSFELLVLQPAPQNSTLTFTIELVGIQWNEYVAP